MCMKNSRSHRSPGDICQGIRSLHHVDVGRGPDKLELLHKILRHGELAGEENSLGDNFGQLQASRFIAVITYPSADSRSRQRTFSRILG